MEINKKYMFHENIQPIILIGAVIILLPIFSYMTLDNIHRQKVQSINLLLEKGTALIRSFEAGTRSGMRGIHWDTQQLENLLSETAMLPDIAYILVTDPTGNIIAHNTPSKIGQKYGEALALKQIVTSKTPAWRILKGEKGQNIFEVYRKFSPIPPHFSETSMHGMNRMHQQMRHHAEAGKKFDQTIIFLGLNMHTVETAVQSDIQHTIIMAVILLLIGFAGIIFLFLTYRFQETRSTLSEIRIFSDTLVDNMTIGLIALDNDDKIIRINPTAEKILDIEADTTIGSHAETVLPETLYRVILDLRLINSDIEREIYDTLGNQKKFLLEVNATNLKDHDFTHKGILLLFKDLTEIKKLREQVARGEKLASIGRLAAGVAHEIRNPLSSIKGYATFFKEIFTNEPENKETAIMMIEEVDRLNRVVSQMVNFAKPIVLRRRAVNINTLIQEAVKLIEPEAEKKQVSIITDSAEGMDDGFLDIDQMKQVLINLILNAIESVEKDNGKIYISTAADAEKEMITISISDTGSGIKQEEIPNIFDPYFTTKPSGTGLGLAIVYNIIKAHEGEIKVESEPGKGSTFTINLPMDIPLTRHEENE